MVQFRLFPQGKTRIITFSYDDGHENDERLIALFNKYGVKATFNLNGKHYIDNDEAELARLRKLYEGHEIASHTYSHSFPSQQPLQTVIEETVSDRKVLEKPAGYLVVGMAYPNGDYSEASAQAIASCGIVYSRTTKSTHSFALPENFMQWHPTCHHRDAFPLAEKFMYNITSPLAPYSRPLLYIWGHSHELRNEDDWANMEKLVALVAGNEKVWYATNIEIYDYLNALKQLRISYDEKIFINRSNVDLWVERDNETLFIPAGRTVTL